MAGIAPSFPTIQATEPPGRNIYALIHLVYQALRGAGHQAEAQAFKRAAFGLQVYDKVLAHAQTLVSLARYPDVNHP